MTLHLSNKQLLVLALLGFAAQGSAWAAEAEASTINVGGAQLEFKLSETRDDRDATVSVRERATPFLARIGIASNAELRIETDGRTTVTETERATGAKISTQGYADATIGVRWRYQDGDEKKNTPAIAVQAAVGVPSGTSVLRAGSVATTIKLIAEWDLGNDASIGIMPGLLHERNAVGQWYTAPSIALTLGKNWTPKFRTTVELVAPRLSSVDNGGNEATANLGATYTLSDNFELEAVYLRGITKTTPESSFLFGVNIKF
jgi:Putative MetA-pathway of phenol degradation